MNISLTPFAPQKMVSRDGFGSPVTGQPAHLKTWAEYGAYLPDSSRVPRRRPLLIYIIINIQRNYSIGRREKTRNLTYDNYEVDLTATDLGRYVVYVDRNN